MLNKSKAKVYLELFHGRKSLKQNMDDWGDEGPIFGPYQWVHTTYNSEIKLGPDWEENEGGPAVLHIVDDCVYYNGMYYGDWSVTSREVIDGDSRLKGRIEKFEFNKAKTKITSTENEVDLKIVRENSSLIKEAAELLGTLAKSDEHLGPHEDSYWNEKVRAEEVSSKLYDLLLSK